MTNHIPHKLVELVLDKLMKYGQPAKLSEIAGIASRDKYDVQGALDKLAGMGAVYYYYTGHYTPAGRPIPGAVPVDRRIPAELPPITGTEKRQMSAKQVNSIKPKPREPLKASETLDELAERLRIEKKNAKPQQPTPEQLNEAARRHKQTIGAGKPLPPTPRRGGKVIRRVQRKTSETRAEHIKRLEDIDRMTGNTQQEDSMTARSVIEKSQGEDEIDDLMTCMTAQPRFRIPPIDNLDYKAGLVMRMARKLPEGVASTELSELADFLVALGLASEEYDNAMVKWEELQV